MNSKKLIFPFLLFILLINWYIFARFTVDDAFITWRYGKNLIDFGIWNYNPSNKDMTQAYTNPIYALLSIVPNLLRLDVVLFFKIISSFILLAFLAWSKHKFGKSWYLALFLVAMPATIIHIYSGLETFLFVWLMAALMIALYEEDRRQVIVITLLLFATRPEAWLLSAIVPIYYLVDETTQISSNNLLPKKLLITRFKFTPLRGFNVGLVLCIPLAIYFAYHRIHFGHALPNTFYIKSGAYFDIFNFLKFSIFLLPLVILFLLNRYKLGLLALAMFGAMVVSYSTSLLYMDYAGRFAFHLFTPIYLFTVYLSSRSDVFVGPANLKAIFWPFPFDLKRYVFTINAFVFCSFVFIGHTNVLGLAMYYPRALNSHAELGKVLGRISAIDDLRSFSIGDAGMAAYYSSIETLDNIGLGSSAIATSGITPSLIENYGIDLMVFYVQDERIKFSEFRQQALFDWGSINGFTELCDIYWLSNYKLRVFSRKPYPEIINLCLSSKLHNDRSNKQMIRETLVSFPWRYWIE